MAKLTLPADRELALKVVETHHARDQKNIELGWIGVVLGDVKHKPGNIAFLAIVSSFVLIAVLMFTREQADLPRRELITLLGTIITGALGYLFGRGHSEKGSD
jgi:hypothetical protein